MDRAERTSETLGGYRIVRLLGRGGMGEVWLAYDERLERLVAVKRIRREVAEDAGRRARFRREARLAARLHHPNVVQIFDLVERDDGDALVMEYVEGRSLVEMLAEGPLEPGRALALATGIARGLEAAHGAGLIHRDLKAGNVLVSREGKAKILDFGLARPLGPDPEATLTGSGDLLGTAHALSPEQIRGEPVDARADLFALGGLLYEMLGGAAPFRAGSLTETLRNIVERTPRTALAELRPGLGAGACQLVDDLLAKRCSDRPSSAAEVAERLRGLTEALPAHVRSGPSPSQLDELPTLDAFDDSSGLRRQSVRAAPKQRIRLAAALGLALLVLALTVVALRTAPWRVGGGASELRVAVPHPTSSTTGGNALLTVGVAVELQRGLLALEGITPVDPSQIGPLEAGPIELARAVGADEVLSASVETEPGLGLVVLSRLRASDGGVVWAETVQVPSAPEDSTILSNALASALRRAYPEHAPRAGVPRLEARPEDYAELLRIKQSIDRGDLLRTADLDCLEQLAVTSPRFVDAHVLAAQVALSLHRDTKDEDLLERAGAAVERGKQLWPSYPPLLQAEIRLALAEGKTARAEELLSELEAASPGDLLVPHYRARLAESRGHLGEAIAVMRRSVERRATWRGLFFLADYEVRAGEIDAARAHLEASLELASNLEWPLAKLARLELFYGDLERAGELYERLIAAGPHRSDLVNLGLARYLLGDYAAAVESYRRALELGGEHVAVTLNLADAELARGHLDAAYDLYARTLAAFEKLERAAPLRPAERTAKAQCLLRLGRIQPAVEIVIDALRDHPDEAEVLYQAALVFALAGEEASAVGYARKALELGYQTRWFRIPGFEGLRVRDDFRRLLDGVSPPQPGGGSPRSSTSGSGLDAQTISPSDSRTASRR